MKLSEAIRLGSMLRPQAVGDYYVNGGSCALGAATEAVGLRQAWLDADDDESPSDDAFPIITTKSHCPVCRAKDDFAYTVTHLNDDHRWTREAIADWVEGIENSVASAPQSVDAVDPVAVAKADPSTRV